MARIIVLTLCVLFSGAVFSEPELKGGPEELRGFLHPMDKVVTIRGQAEEKAYSDKAVISLVITTEDKLLSQAIAKNGEVRQKITTSLISSGIANDSIKSSKFSSSPQYGWFGSKPSSFKVINRMAISITDEAHLQEIAVVADKFGEVELSDTAFEHTKKDEFNEKVKAKALENILKQKEFYEKTLGVKLTPIGIRDSDIHLMATRGAMVLEQAVMAPASMAPDQRDSKAYSSAAKYRDQSNEPSFDEVKYAANITVDFKIGD